MPAWRTAAVSTVVAVSVALPAVGDPAAGRRKAGPCATCHGIDGIAVNPEAPNIAGESPIYLERQLKAFRAGTRRHEQMSIVAASLSDQDIVDLVGWYASIRVSAEMPEP